MVSEVYDELEDQHSAIEFSVQDAINLEDPVKNLAKPTMISTSSQTNLVRTKDKGAQTNTTYYRSKCIQANLKTRGINTKTQTTYNNFLCNKSVQTSFERGM